MQSLLNPKKSYRTTHRAASSCELYILNNLTPGAAIEVTNQVVGCGILLLCELFAI